MSDLDDIRRRALHCAAKYPTDDDVARTARDTLDLCVEVGELRAEGRFTRHDHELLVRIASSVAVLREQTG